MGKIHLSDKRCVACEGGVPPLSEKEAKKLLKEVDNWELADGAAKIQKTFTFENFVEAMLFSNHVAHIAESEGHHPDMHVSWGKVVIQLTTHAINGLSENDFIVASKIDLIPR